MNFLKRAALKVKGLKSDVFLRERTNEIY